MVGFRSTHLNTLSASLAGGPLVVVGLLVVGSLIAGLPTAIGTSLSRGRRLALKKFAGHTGPTSVHNRHIVVRYSDSHKMDIYKKKQKIK
jgi:hypothetical protein